MQKLKRSLWANENQTNFNKKYENCISFFIESILAVVYFFGQFFDYTIWFMLIDNNFNNWSK